MSVLDIATVMAGGDLSAVGADFECMSGIDYGVNSHLVSSVMDRYTGNIGI
jgi:hypothetical protein